MNGSVFSPVVCQNIHQQDTEPTLPSTQLLRRSQNASSKPKSMGMLCLWGSSIKTLSNDVPWWQTQKKEKLKEVIRFYSNFLKQHRGTFVIFTSVGPVMDVKSLL